ncbi:MAG: pseudouridylate synthase [Bdellovibrionaceae bacterium]|nr:pseudouridylate synthase [Pseudobdellovibrionaceae bacterium]|tara:strand:- start:3224 stop:3916 length:693 start_codon:yes stop_codon:yes gene_type:complete
MNFNGLEILFEDEDYLAVHKPAGLLTHPSAFSGKETDHVMTRLASSYSQVTPVHRLDRATSGVLLLAKNLEARKQAALLFQDRKIKKKYVALTRGWIPKSGVIEASVKSSSGKKKEALTRFERKGRIELPFSSGKYPCSWFSWVEVFPETGKYHQIRQHFRHLRHPLIGDRKWGDGKVNLAFRTAFGFGNLFLFAQQLSFTHPQTQEEIEIKSNLPSYFLEIRDLPWNWD